MPDPGDTARGDQGQGTSSSGGLGANTSGGSTYGGGGGRDSGAGGGGGMGSYGGSTEGSRQGGGSGTTSGIGGGTTSGGSTEGARQGGGGTTTSGVGGTTTSPSQAGGGNTAQGGVSGIASSGFQGPGVNAMNAPATATSTQAYSGYSTPGANTSGGIASLGNQTQNTAFGGFQGPGVNGMNAPVTSTSGVPGNLGPRATSPQYTNAPTAGLGSYVSPPKQFTESLPRTYNDLGVAGIPADSGPYQGGYGNFDPASQAYAVDRGLIGSQNFAENYTPPQAVASYNPLTSVSAAPPPVSTVGANSPFADQSVQAYDPVQSFQNYVVPAAQALSGAPPVGPGNMSVVGGQGIVAFDSLGAAPPGYGNAMGINQPTQVASTPPVGPGNMSVVGGQGSVAFDSLGASPPGYGNARGINQPTVATSTNIVGVSGLADPNITGPAYMGPGTTARWSALENQGQIQPVNSPYDTFALPSVPEQTVASSVPNRVTSYGPMVDQYSFVPAEQLSGAMEQRDLSGPTPYAGAVITSQGVLANRTPPATVVADNEPAYTPSTQPVYTPDYSNDDLMDLPDPAAPTDQYVPPVTPGQEDYFPGTNPTDWATRGQNDLAYNVPPAPPAPPIVPEPEDPDKDGLGWMRYYPSQYATQSQTVALPELTYMRDPASTGVGSLLPNIQVTPYRTI